MPPYPSHPDSTQYADIIDNSVTDTSNNRCCKLCLAQHLLQAFGGERKDFLLNLGFDLLLPRIHKTNPANVSMTIKSSNDACRRLFLFTNL